MCFYNVGSTTRVCNTPDTTWIQDDFDYLLSDTVGELLGEGCSNPFSKFYTKKQVFNDNNVRIRQTCCFSYEAEKKKMCKTCPKLYK
ncbi:hypothetical protein GN156_02640 [bacterium LRH843]|nr:hypothetical protein [bacterium LRH843]